MLAKIAPSPAARDIMTQLIARRMPAVYLSRKQLRSAAWLLLLVPLPSWSQRSGDPSVASAIAGELPDAPLPQATGAGHTPQQGSGSVIGTVLDINGGIVSGAKVALSVAGSSNQGGAAERVAVSDPEGRFTFENLPPGNYKLTVTAQDLQTYVSTPFALHAGERHELPRVALPIARTTADVVVTVTQVELATEQIHAAEQQRVFGVLPNFYSSYIWDAAPLNTKQKFGLAFKATTDPVAFLAAGYVAGIQQANNVFKGYGQGVQGYAKRYGAAYADGAIGTMLSNAILPSLLHQDPRYFYKGSGTKRSRALYAISTAFICKGDNGRWQPNYSHLLGGIATGAISNAYYPSSDRGVMLTIDNALIGIGGDMAGGLIREFVMRGLTHSVPAYEQGKPKSQP